MGIFQRYLRHRQVSAWRRNLRLDAHAQMFNQLYQPVNGFILSKAARKKGDALEYVYGEIEFEPFVALLSLCQPNAKTVFYDLGSGVGKAVLAFQLVYQGKKSCGIELFPELHHAALAQKTALAEHPHYYQAAQGISFQQGDFLHVPISEANLLFINATAFFGDYWQQVSLYLEQQLKPGTQVISTSKPLKSTAFQIVHHTPVGMSFGQVEAYIHQRLE